jgi:hypothetical protein
LLSAFAPKGCGCLILSLQGGSLRHLVNALAELEALGLTFISLRDNLDLSTPSGRLMFQIIGAMAEFERSLIQERVKAGMRNGSEEPAMAALFVVLYARSYGLNRVG